MRFEFFRDDTVALESFKADQADWITENSAPSSGRRPTIFPRSREKRVIKEEFPVNNFGRMQGFVFNLRRRLFNDVAAAPGLQLCL